MNRILSFIAISLFFVSCAHKTAQQPLVDNEVVIKSEKKISEKLEKEKLELELQNNILMKALSDRKKSVVQTAHGQVVQQFPQFEELIYDQAKTAYQEKDITRLTEAVRILKANQPQSKYLESMYFWLAHIQQSQGLNNESLVTYDEFLKIFPESQYAPQAMFLKGELYERINLREQAFEIYSDLKNRFPGSRERYLAEAKLKEYKRK